MALLPPSAVSRLIKISGLLASDADGERANAAAKATELLRAHGLTWAEALAPLLADPAPPDQPEDAAWRENLVFCLRPAFAHLWNPAEADFLRNISRRPRITGKQRTWLRQLHRRAQVAASAPWRS